MPNVQDLRQYFDPIRSTLIAAPNGGWAPANPVENSGAGWAYTSPNSVSTSASGVGYYTKGDRVRLKQGGAYKYYYIVSVGPTGLIFSGGTDYAVANAPITDYEISKAPNPDGFPPGFNYAANPTGFTTAPSTASYRFSLNGGLCSVQHDVNTPGTSNSTSYGAAAPVLALNGILWTAPTTILVDNSVVQTLPGRVFIIPGTSNFIIEKDMAGAPFTASGGKGATFQIWYEF